MARMWEGRREVLWSAGGGSSWKTDFKSESQLGAGEAGRAVCSEKELGSSSILSSSLLAA